ncbi:autotransporter domain-containing protein [Stenotrophomonas sp. SY1]|uniref:autotransporter domain-containing protein n=1 Tax=Stenotrophomonas sp. SY1 TaxID=477235 RepID=UPI001E5DC5D4|nr:autotransporter domain-containing protein [Stenotrophomonas sp. SY1]MCD9087686.1 autotransporter domain-containing protein [Stenotrophomonas sp. SY1]
MVRSTKPSTQHCKRPRRWGLANSISVVLASQAFLLTPAAVQAQNAWVGGVSNEITDLDNWADGQSTGEIGDALINGNTPNLPVWTIGKPSVSPNFSETYLYVNSLTIGDGSGSNGLLTVNTLLADSYRQAQFYVQSSGTSTPITVGADGGTGVLTFNLHNGVPQQGTVLNIESRGEQSGFVVGKGAGSSGTVSIQGLGNSLYAQSMSNPLSSGKVVWNEANHIIGSDGGTGTVTVQDASWITQHGASDPVSGYPTGSTLTLGTGSGSVGNVNILAGGKLHTGVYPSPGYRTSDVIGADGGNGALTVSGVNAEGYASNANFSGGLDIGNGLDAVGTANVLSGGKLLTYVGEQSLHDPVTGGFVTAPTAQIGLDGGTGQATVSGSGSIWYVAGATSEYSNRHIDNDGVDPDDSSEYIYPVQDDLLDQTVGHLHVGVSGTGSLTIADGGVVALGTAYLGNVYETTPTDQYSYYGLLQFDEGQGTLFLGETATGNGTLNIGAAAGQAAAASGELRAGMIQFGPGAGTVVLNHTNTAYVFSTPLVGNGVLANHAGTTWLQPHTPVPLPTPPPSPQPTDNSGFTGTTELYGGTLGLGYALALGTSAVQVKGNAKLIYANGIDINNTIDLQAANTLTTSVADGGTATQTGAISGTGNLLKADVGTLALTSANTYTGETTIAGGTLALSGAGSIAQSSRVVADGIFDISAATSPVSIQRLAGSGTVNFGSQSLSLTAAADTFAGNLAGTGDFNVLAGVQTLSGDSSAFAGNTHVQGELWVNGSLGLASTLTTVDNGGLLGGGGVVGGSVLVNDGVLVPGAIESVPGQLRIGGDLTLSPDATMRFLFGQAGVPGGALNDLLSVGGNLVLDGTLNVTEAPGGAFDPGIYRVIDYAGTLDDRGLTLGSLPPSSGTVTVQTSVGQQVNLVLVPTGTQVTLSFWDGAAGPKDDGQINGGNGIWQNSTGNNNWTNTDGTINAAFADGSFAVFTGAPGDVTVDGSLGGIEVVGMQFASGGYVVGGDAITLLGPEAIVRVGASTLGRREFLTRGPEHQATINAVLAGDARLVKSDAGTLVLNGNNTYSGGTYIRNGLVQIASDQALGASTGALAFDFGALRSTADITSARAVSVETSATFLTADATTLTLTGALTGSGALVKGGGGVLHLTGTSSLSGATQVASGMLKVDGSLADSAVTVDYSAILAGNGSVGSTVVRSGGIISPGSSIGTLTINGDYTQEAGSRYIVEVDPTSSASDLIAASGAATLGNGALLQVVRTNDALYRAGTRYTVLSADGGVSGEFTAQGELAVSPFLTLTDTYDANHAYLEVLQTGQLTDVDCTPNANAAAGGAGGLAQDGDLNTALLNQLDNAAVCDALGQLTGEIYASLRGAQLEDSRFVREAIGNRVRGANIGPHEETVDDGVWAHAFGSWGRFDHGSDTQVLSRDISGLFVGADWSLSDAWRIGLLGGFSNSDFDVNRWRSSADSDDKHLALYTGGEWDNGFGFHGGLAYAWHDIEIKRQVDFAHFSDQLRADYKATTRQVFTEANYRMQMAHMVLQPFLNVAYVQLDSDGFSEHGGEAALSARSQDNDLTFATLGMRSLRQFELSGGGNITLRAMAGWRHVFGDRSPNVDLGFISGGAFTIQGVPLARQALAAELGVEASPRTNLRLGLTYSGQLGGGIDDHGGKAFVEWKF